MPVVGYDDKQCQLLSSKQNTDIPPAPPPTPTHTPLPTTKALRLKMATEGVSPMAQTVMDFNEGVCERERVCVCARALRECFVAWCMRELCHSCTYAHSLAHATRHTPHDMHTHTYAHKHKHKHIRISTRTKYTCTCAQRTHIPSPRASWATFTSTRVTWVCIFCMLCVCIAVFADVWLLDGDLHVCMLTYDVRFSMAHSQTDWYTGCT